MARVLSTAATLGRLVLAVVAALHLALGVAWAALAGAVGRYVPLFLASGPPPLWVVRVAGAAVVLATRAEAALLPAEAVVIRRLAGVLSGAVDAALADLGVFTALCEAQQRRGGRAGTTAAALATTLGCNADFLFRLLRAAASTGAVAVVGGGGGSGDDAADPVTTVRFGTTALSRALGATPTSPAAAFLAVHAAHLGPAYTRLADAARSGVDACSLAHGGTPFWTRLAKHPTCDDKTFSLAMKVSESLISTRALAGARDWTAASTIVDIGGAHGSLLARLLSLSGPGTAGILFDRPAVVEAARAAWTSSPRVSFVGGDFFKPSTLPRLGYGTVAVARHILHDWSDADATRILQALRSAVAEEKEAHGGAGSAAHLCLLELVLPPSAETPVHPSLSLLDINMMAAVAGGRERTAREWQTLLAAGGWRLTSIKPIGIVCLIEAVPAVGGDGAEG